MTLSTRYKEATKTALAMTIAYGIGLQAGWDRPYWAGFAIAFISLATVGQSLNKGALRMAGTLVAAVVAFTLLGLFVQHRWLFIFFLSLWFGLCTYMNTGKRHQYFWFVAAFVSLIIASSGSASPAQSFSIAMLRIQQTGLGILVYTLVTIFLWPNHSRKAFEETALKVLGTQRSLFGETMSTLAGSGSPETLQSLRNDEIDGNARLAVLLDAAVSDSEEIRQAARLWREYQALVGELAETMQQWREDFAVLDSLPVKTLLPGLDALGIEVDARFTAIAGLLDGAQETFRCGRTALEPDATALDQLSHFHRAALLVTQGHLLRIDALSRALFDNVSAIRGLVEPVIADGDHTVVRPLFAPDPDRLLAAGKMMLVVWMAFLLVIYVPDFPGGMGFVSMCGPIGLILVGSPQIPVSMLFGPFATGIALAAALYIFVMPQLSGFAELGLMIFAATFYICYRYAAPQQALGRVISLAMFVVVISVSNQQSYSFLSVANTSLMFALLFMLLLVVAYFPFSAMPQRVSIRLLRRYFHSAKILLARDAASSATAQTPRRDVFHRQEIANLPGKVQTWTARVTPQTVGADAVQQLPLLVGSMQALTYRLQALLEARGLPQSPLLASALENDMQQWRLAVVEVFQHLSEGITDSKVLSRERLRDKLATLEDRIAEAMDGAAAGTLSAGDSENFYRLLGAYRGCTETLLDFADLVRTIDWQPWHEERFA